MGCLILLFFSSDNTFYFIFLKSFCSSSFFLIEYTKVYASFEHLVISRFCWYMCVRIVDVYLRVVLLGHWVFGWDICVRHFICRRGHTLIKSLGALSLIALRNCECESLKAKTYIFSSPLLSSLPGKQEAYLAICFP